MGRAEALRGLSPAASHTHPGRATLDPGVLGELGRGAGRPPPWRPIQRAAGEPVGGWGGVWTAGAAWGCGGRAGPVSASRRRLRLAGLRGLLPFHSFPPFPSLPLVSCKLLAETLRHCQSRASVSKRTSSWYRGGGHSWEDTQTGLGWPPPQKSDLIPWDPTRTREKPPAAARAPGQLCSQPAGVHTLSLPPGWGPCLHLAPGTSPEAPPSSPAQECRGQACCHSPLNPAGPSPPRWAPPGPQTPPLQTLSPCHRLAALNTPWPCLPSSPVPPSV